MKGHPFSLFTLLRIPRENWIFLSISLGTFLWFAAHPFYFDDAFISMRISRNIWEGLGPFHNLEEKVQTNTSLLFPFLVAPFQAFERNTALSLTVGLDFLLGFFILSELMKALRRHPAFALLSTSARTYLAIWLGLGFFFNRILVPGMETQLYLLLLLFTWNALTQKKLYGFFVGFAASFIRPEGFLLALVFWLAGKWSLRNRIQSLALAMGLAAVFLGCQWLLFQQWIPHTIVVKSHIEPDWLHSLSAFIFQTLLPFRNPLALVVHVMGIAFLVLHIRRENFRILSLYLIFYAFIFCVLAGGSTFFGWYQSPLKLFLLLAAGWLCLDLYSLWEKRTIPIMFGISLSLLPVLSDSVRFRQDGIFKSATDLAALTQSDPYTLTCEPIGILGYFNPHVQFRDYPGLASGRSLEILSKWGPVTRSQYFDNAAFREIILQGGADLVLLSPPEAINFRIQMQEPKFIYLGKLGEERISEHNSAFYVWMNREVVPVPVQQKLQKRALSLGFLSHSIP